MLDSTAAIPLYIQLMRHLEGEILRGERAAGERLPSESQLAQQFGVSVITVRSAIKGLSDRGLVDRKQGKGTFVRGVKYRRDPIHLSSFSDSCHSQGVEPGGQMLANQEVKLSPQMACDLGQDPGSHGVYIRRLRYADGVPVAIEQNYFPMTYAYLLHQRFDNRSLFRFLKEHDKITLWRSDKSIELCRATQEESELLEIPVDSPLLLVKSIAYTQLQEPLYVGIQRMNGDRFTLQLTQTVGEFPSIP